MGTKEDINFNPRYPLSLEIQIQKIIEASRSKEVFNMPMIQLYRAIHGPPRYTKGQDIYPGVKKQRLKRYGFFENNRSLAQFGYKHSIRSLTEPNPYRRVPGLPVFLNLPDVLFWLDGRKYSSQPALGILDLPLTHFRGPNQILKLTQNYLSETENDREIKPQELVRHISGIKLLEGEFYLTGSNEEIPLVPESVKQYQIILRPKLAEDGSVDFTSAVEKLTF